MTRIIALLTLALPLGATAQERMYFESSLGALLTPTVTVRATDNDWSTRCDLIINPNGVETGTECDRNPPPTDWSNTSGRSTGFAAGFAAGYRMGWVSTELEYRYRTAGHHDYAPTAIGDEITLDKADQELERAVGGVGDVSAHSLLANVVVRFGNRSVAPYVGVGAGVSRMTVDYFSLWKRNDDPSRISTFADPALRAKVAGTTTVGSAVLVDYLPGFQLLAGADIRVAERVSLGVKLRRTHYGEFRSDPQEWDQLRSHESSVGRGERILYEVRSADTGAWTITVGLRFGI